LKQHCGQFSNFNLFSICLWQLISHIAKARFRHPVKTWSC